MRWFNFTTGCLHGITISNQLPFTVDSIGDPILNTNDKVVRNFALEKGIVVTTLFWECDTVELNSEFVKLF